MPTDTRHPIAPARLVGPLGLTRAGIEAAQADDVAAAAARCDCTCRRAYYGDDDPDTYRCGRHGDDADARDTRGTYLCECDREDLRAEGVRIMLTAHSSYLGCRACTTCARCHQRAELVDGEVCEACDDLRTEQQEARAREGEWAAANPEAVYAPPSRF